jgi:hypothetical protein
MRWEKLSRPNICHSTVREGTKETTLKPADTKGRATGVVVLTDEPAGGDAGG